MAIVAGLEPTTKELTALCTAIVLHDIEMELKVRVELTAYCLQGNPLNH